MSSARIYISACMFVIYITGPCSEQEKMYTTSDKRLEWKKGKNTYRPQMSGQYTKCYVEHEILMSDDETVNIYDVKIM